MNALAIVDSGEEVTDLLIGITKVLVVRQIDLFFLDGTDDAFSGSDSRWTKTNA